MSKYDAHIPDHNPGSGSSMNYVIVSGDGSGQGLGENSSRTLIWDALPLCVEKNILTLFMDDPFESIGEQSIKYSRRLCFLTQSAYSYLRVILGQIW